MNELELYQNPRNLLLTTFLDHLGPADPTGLFFKNRKLFLLYDYLTSKKKSEETDEPILRRTDKRTSEQSQIHRTIPLARVSNKASQIQ